MKFLAWCAAWTFYGVGHFISLIFHKFDSLSMILYPIYNKLMVASSDISDKYGLDVWMSRQERLNRLIDELVEMMEEDDELTIPFIIEMLLKDYDPVYVAMVAKELQQQLWDQVNLGIEVGDTVAEISAAVGNRTPGVIFMNPRVIGPVIGKEDLMSKEDIINLTRECLPDYDKELSFKVGKAYRHSSGCEMKIIGWANTTVHGDACMIAEEKSGHLKPVGSDPDAAVNWKEISEDEWMKNFS